MPRLKDMTPPATTETRRAWWCHRHGWWIDDSADAETTPECGIGPCGGRQMAGPYTATISFSPTSEGGR